MSPQIRPASIDVEVEQSEGWDMDQHFHHLIYTFGCSIPLSSYPPSCACHLDHCAWLVLTDMDVLTRDIQRGLIFIEMTMKAFAVTEEVSKRHSSTSGCSTCGFQQILLKRRFQTYAQFILKYF